MFSIVADCLEVLDLNYNCLILSIVLGARLHAVLPTIHADLWGPVRHESFSGEVMVLGLVDDYSRFRWSVPIAKKSDVTTIVIEFIRRMERSRDCNVSVFHSDNGGEFVNNALKVFFKDRGIEHRTTVPYAHYQNGVVERGWRTMFKTVRIWLLVSGLPLSFWAFASNTFTYVSNCPTTAALPGSTPFEMYHLRKANVSRVRVWGCVAYVRITPERHPSKIEPPRVKARFIGYADQGWMFWRPDTNTVFVSDDANFDESSFEIQRGESDEAALRKDAPTTIFGDAPADLGTLLNLNLDGDNAVDQDFAPDGAVRAHAPGAGDQATTPVAARRALAAGGDGRAPPPVASRRPSDDADNNPPDPNQIPDGYEPVVSTTEWTSELAERWGAPAGSRRRGGAEQQAMFVDVGTILGDVIPPRRAYGRARRRQVRPTLLGLAE